MKKKKIIAAGLGVIMALTAAGCHSASKNRPPETTAKESRKEDKKETKEDKKETKDESEKETGEESGSEKGLTLGKWFQRTPKTLHPNIHTEYTSGYVSDGVWINYSLKTAGLILNEEEAAAYPKLDQALSEEYNSLKESTKADLDNLKESAESMTEYAQTGNMQLTAEYTPNILRADENVVSFEQYYYDYYGGAHGYNSYTGFTFDTKTGKKLELSDVITGESKVKEGIVKELKSRYADEEGLVENNTPQDDADAFFEYLKSPDTKDAVAWSLGTDRLNICYNPYNIGSWALGIVRVSLPFKTYPDIVKEEYQAAPSDYAVKLDIYTDYSADIYNDGNFTDISVYPDGADEYAYSALQIQLKKEDGQVISNVFDDMYYFNCDAYYVKTGDRHFVHVLTNGESDWTTDNVYEITNGQIQSLGYVEGSPALIDYDGYSYGNAENITVNINETAAYNDPNAIYLGTTMNAFSTYSGNRYYQVGKTGALESHGPYMAGPTDTELVVKRTLTVEETDLKGRETGKTKEIPAGTKLQFYMTDNESYVIFRYDGDQYGKVSMDNSDWPQKINGEELETILDGTMFAG